MRPLPFKARFIPRSEDHKKQILDAGEAARIYLKEFEGETKVRMEDLEM